MKRILLLNDHLEFGGGGDAVLKLEERALRENGFEVFSLGFGKDDLEFGRNYTIKLPTNKRQKFLKFIYSKHIQKKISRIIRDISPQLIHIHLSAKVPMAIYNLTELAKIPVIQTLHGPNLFCATSWGGLKNSGPCELGIGLKCYSRGCTNALNTMLYYQLKERYWTSLKTNINVFHCPSINILNSTKRLGLSNSVYIPLGIDEMFLEDPLPKIKKRPTLLFVGAIAEQKGVQYLLPTLALVKKIFPDVLLRIAGRGILDEKLKSDTRKLDLEDNVEFVGFVNHDDIHEFYLSGHVFLIPSIWQEQFGLVGPEALACKIPCIGTSVGGIPEWLHNNENGLLVPPNDIESLSEAIITLLSDDILRKKMGENGRNYSIEYHNPKKYATKMIELINHTISTNE